VPERRRVELEERIEERQSILQNKRDRFITQHHLEHAQEESIIRTEEAADLAFWCEFQSWTFCQKCQMLEPRKLQPSFARRTPTPLNNSCKCGNRIYTVPCVEDVPIILRSLSPQDQRLLSPFDIHCGDYVRHFNGYRQRTEPFRVTWCPTLVADKIEAVADHCRKERLQHAYQFLMENVDSSYHRFVRLQANQ